jgi:hypothetical protein
LHRPDFDGGVVQSFLSIQTQHKIRLSRKHTKKLKAEILLQAIGTSGMTGRATLDYIKLLRPKLFILENVSGIMESTNLNFLYDAIRAAGYQMTHRAFHSSDYGVPQRRVRVFFLGVNLEAFGLTADDAKNRLEQTLLLAEAMEFQSKPLESLLLDRDHPKVNAELARVTGIPLFIG